MALGKHELAKRIRGGLAHCAERRYEEARDAFAAIRALDAGQPYAEIGLGSVCFAEGNFPAAIGHFREALKLSPRNAYAYALLAESQIFQSDYAAARLSIRRAKELDAQGPYGRLAQNLLTFLESLPGA